MRRPQDEMLQPEQMLALYRKHGRPPWSFVPLEGARHMDAYETHAAQYWPALRDFVDGLCSEGDGRTA